VTCDCNIYDHTVTCHAYIILCDLYNNIILHPSSKFKIKKSKRKIKEKLKKKKIKGKENK